MSLFVDDFALFADFPVLPTLNYLLSLDLFAEFESRFERIFSAEVLSDRKLFSFV